MNNLSTEITELLTDYKENGVRVSIDTLSVAKAAGVLSAAFLVVYALLIIWVAVDIVTRKRKPINWPWVIVMLFGNALAGTALYLLFTREPASEAKGT